LKSISISSKWYGINAAEQELELLHIHRQLSRKKSFLKEPKSPEMATLAERLTSSPGEDLGRTE